MFEFEGLPPKCCPECQKSHDSDYARARELVKARRGINAIELNEQTGIPIETITRYIKEGLLEPMKYAPSDEGEES
jgi:hypothetical protein